MKDNALYQLFASGTLASHKPGEIITYSNDPPKDVYLLKSGYVKVFSVNSRGEEYLHIIYKPGEIFPLTSLNNHHQNGIYFSSIENAVTYSLPIAKLLEEARHNSAVATALAMQTVDQFNVYVNRVDNLEYKFGRERLVYRILFLAGRFGKHSARGITIDVPITQKTLGSSVNLSRETVARELRRLESRGLVKYEDRRILILNVEHLCNELKDPISADFWGLNPQE